MNSEERSEKPSALRLGSYRESLRIGELLRAETVGGAVLVIAAAVAVVLANSPLSEAYFDLRDTRFGYAPWHLELSVGAWAADGLLAIFFFLVGLELKREFVAGDLRDPQRAVVPVAAAFGGVAVPALIYTGINLGTDASRGWAVPTATDIAFAVAVLAIIGSHLPSALRIFLLTLAVVDDLIAITIIAIFYTDSLSIGHFAAAVVPLALFGWLAHSRRRFFAQRAWAAWVVLLPLGVVTWALVHASGVHATVAGVLLGFAVPVLRSRAGGDPGDAREADGPGLAEIFEHRFRPISTGIAVPVFAFFSAGVAVGGMDAIGATLTDTVSVGITAGLVLGKPIGIMGTTWLVTTLTRSRLDSTLKWIDMLGVSLLAGIGFTVSLLVAELSFGHSAHGEHAKVAILSASVLAAALAACVLLPRNRYYRRLEAEQSVDTDRDGIPDAYERGD